MDMHEWIDGGLKQPGKKAAVLARLLGVKPDKISKMRAGTRQPQARELPIIEKYLGERAPGTIPEGFAEETAQLGDDVPQKVRLVGYVGAAAEAHFYAIDQQDLDEVPAPEGSTPSTVAVEIRGTSLGALFDRWLVFYDDVRRPVTSDLIGRLCVVGLADERVLIKKIKRGRDGMFTLLSNTEDPIHDAVIEWAARVKTMVPR